MQCARCNNDDQTLFYLGEKGYYCRKCISFKRRILDEELPEIDYEISDNSEELFLNYQLSKQQQVISDKCLKLCQKESIILNAVCGAGKTEIVLASIAYFLKQKKRVGYAISRKQVVLEIAERLNDLFKNAKVIGVCGGHTNEIYGDLIVCTTHQLYRYEKYFDLLILDECDAFPYKGNEVLQNIAANSVNGNIIYSSATIDDYLAKKMHEGMKTLVLNERYHGYDLPVPKQVYGLNLFLILYLLKYIKKNSNQVLVFVPTIETGLFLTKIINLKTNCLFISSKTLAKQAIIAKFKNNEIKVLCATTILERGVTFSGIDVVVYHPEHRVFDVSSLIQISGRVGRKIVRPDGDVIFLQNAYSQDAINCIKKLKYANQNKKMSIM